jgi:hypothetical protein
MLTHQQLCCTRIPTGEALVASDLGMQSGIWRSVAEKTLPVLPRNGFDGFLHALPGAELLFSPRLTVFS